MRHRSRARAAASSALLTGGEEALAVLGAIAADEVRQKEWLRPAEPQPRVVGSDTVGGAAPWQQQQQQQQQQQPVLEEEAKMTSVPGSSGRAARGVANALPASRRTSSSGRDDERERDAAGPRQPAIAHQLQTLGLLEIAPPDLT
ncbi:hypothetical protein MNEG_6322 [Monoraphidium neglectum]|uniref:Uncharacterized protein n=1 Tax=Monoraphidium neglectum TaxID=145388 RepID=A0A0D2MET9_9CHLO|nr:hypothetical protein MNEG_6322 [Monoraphidium neglectum]KIZ01640.1 hypothetical protein MNEG_6322 [Monoraphidium neglectum]|eukprot:XP_013900659.1 hypothetical protein MNEG_6322 [Monoraphidium neglectum]